MRRHVFLQITQSIGQQQRAMTTKSQFKRKKYFRNVYKFWFNSEFISLHFLKPDKHQQSRVERSRSEQIRADQTRQDLTTIAQPFALEVSSSSIILILIQI